MDCPRLDCPHHDFVGGSCNLDGLHPYKESVLSIAFFAGRGRSRILSGYFVYLSHWFRYQDRAKVLALFMAAQPVSLFIGSPISGLLLKVHWFGVPGWRWLFIIEGMPAIVFGFVTIFYLTDWPHQARWLPDDERV